MTNNGTMGSLHRGFWNGPLPASFSFILSLFQTNNTIFTTICEKCPSSIPCWDSNPRSLDRKSPPVSTRPGLPPCMHWGSLEEHSQFLSLEAFFSGPSFKSKHFFHISKWSRLFWCEKSRVCSNVFLTKHNQIILYQQLSSQDKTFCVCRPGKHPQENLYGGKYAPPSEECVKEYLLVPPCFNDRLLMF